MRMINADDLEQALREAGLAEIIKDDCSKCTSAWGVPIVDAVEVVRCRDCKFYLYSEEMCGLLNTRLHFYETDNVWTRDCFCAWGKRREDETN